MDKMRTLYNYQQEGVDWGKRRRYLPLFWDMRLGKSIVTIRIIDEWRQQSPIIAKNRPDIAENWPIPYRILILCPKTVIVSWRNELELEKKTFFILSATNKDLHSNLLSLASPDNPIYCVANYEVTKYNNDSSKSKVSSNGSTSYIPINKQKWDVVVLDESTKVRNPKTATTEAVIDSRYSSLPASKYKICLTGTPAPETTIDYFNQFKFLFGTFIGYQNYYKFRKECFDRDDWDANRFIPKLGFQHKLAAHLQKRANILSRKVAGLNIPSTFEIRTVTLAKSARAIYDDFAANWHTNFLRHLIEDEVNFDSSSPLQLATQYATVAQNYLHQLACGYPKSTPGVGFHHKRDEVLSLLQDELRGEKVVIWCRYQRDIDELYSAIKELRDRNPFKITGTITNEQLYHKLRDFNDEYPNSCNNLVYLNVAICQIKKACMGIALYGADTQIFFSRSWSGLENQQATDRLIHPSKANSNHSILTIDIITEDTMDQDVYDAIVRKKADGDIHKLFFKRHVK